MIKKILLSTMAASVIYGNDAELNALKTQLSEMQSMMKTMQEKIDALEKEKNPAVSPVISAQTASTSSPQTPKIITDFLPTFGQAAKNNLDLSLIVDASYAIRSKKDEELAHMGLPGIAHSLIGSHNHEGHSHATYDAQNGFNLNYAELGITSTVDPYLDAAVFLHFYDGGVEVEEAYFTSRNLPYNLACEAASFSAISVVTTTNIIMHGAFQTCRLFTKRS